MSGPARLAVCVLALLVPAAASAAGWEKLTQDDGLLVERRSVDGSPVQEVRVTARTWLPPAALFDTIWKQREYPQFVPYLKRLEILAEAPDERIVYEQVGLPLVRDRDYTVRVRRHADPAAQTYEVSFAATDDMGPAPSSAYVRVRDLTGSWYVEPDGRGSLLRYTIRSDPGGMIPMWVANRAQGDAAANLVKAMIDRTARTHGPEFRAPAQKPAPEFRAPAQKPAPEFRAPASR